MGGGGLIASFLLTSRRSTSSSQCGPSVYRGWHSTDSAASRRVLDLHQLNDSRMACQMHYGVPNTLMRREGKVESLM